MYLNEFSLVPLALSLSLGAQLASPVCSSVYSSHGGRSQIRPRERKRKIERRREEKDLIARRGEEGRMEASSE